ncbi:MAG TPA: DUF2298 domain-containing protein, partial [Chloroflexia bacterium]|nr:DUF2298 domain-containing protein [Chloroflexia bacterium]
GYVLVAAITSLSGVVPAVAFNLANAALFALTALGAFGVVYNLIAGSRMRETSEGSTRQVIRRPHPLLSPYIYAIAAALMVVAMGNLTSAFAVKHVGDEQIEANGWRFCFLCQSPQAYDWFGPSRVVQDYRTGAGGQKEKVGFETINEFPAFSFLLADMHPHVMALPLVLLAVAVALAFARRKVRRATAWRDGIPSGVAGWLPLLGAGLIAGSLYATNTWDYPTYFVIILLARALPYLALQRASEEPMGWRWARPWLVQALILGLVSIVSFLPFHLTFASLVGGDAAVVPANLAGIPVLGGLLQKLGALLLVNTSDKTIVGFLVIFGTFLLPLLVWLVYHLVSLLRARRDDETASPMATYAWAAFALVVMGAAVLLRFPLLALLLPVTVVAFYLVWQQPERGDRNLALLLVGTGALIGLAIEVVFLKDNFQMRMNTLFKFYYQIWVLWALAAAFALWQVLAAALTDRAVPVGQGRVRITPVPVGLKALAGLLAAVTGLLILSGLLYSWYGVQSRQVGGQTAMRGLDGTTWVADSAPDDLAALRWLNANAIPTAVVLETGSDEYQHVGRVSSYTGLGTLVAWDNSHEALWRTNQPVQRQAIGERRQVVDAIYQGVDPTSRAPITAERLLELLHQYHVTYVFAGASERGAAGWAPSKAEQQMTDYAEAVFKQALPEAFRSGSTVVYAVKDTIQGTGVAPAPPNGSPTPAA